MTELPAPSPINGELLCQQLAAQGVTVDTDSLVYDPIRGTIQLPIPDWKLATVQAVVAAHPPTAQAAIDQADAEQSNQTTIRSRASTALQNNSDYLAIASPSNAQVVAQVKALTRQSDGLIRLVLRKLDGTD